MAVVAGAPALADSKTVVLSGSSFNPARVEVSPGDTVVWRYESGGDHTVTFDSGPDLNPACPGLLVDDCLDQPSDSVQRKFDQPGEYPYYCKVHGAKGGQGMAGVVVVSTPAATAPAPAPATTQPPTTTATTRPSTTTTTRPLTTSSTVASSSTTTTVAETTTTLTPSEAPAFDPDDRGGTAAAPGGDDESAGASGPTGNGGSGTVGLIIGLLLAVSGAGGYILWRLRPGRA
jgi:plastocyanin